MAIEWVKKTNNCHYEVRSAGATRRLYSNKVFHSQYNPNKVIQGGIWDLLYLPAFSLDEDKIQRILVLGVGGGTVLQQLNKYIRPRKIVGIELNPVHLQVAKKFFGLKYKSFQLIEADAIKWLADYNGEKFDLIIDDLFGHHDGEAERAITVNKKWSEALLNHLNPEGMLVVNFGSNNELKNSALVAYKKIFNKFSSIFRLTLSQYENAIGVFSFVEASPIIMKNTFESVTGLSKKMLKEKINYNIKIFK